MGWECDQTRTGPRLETVFTEILNFFQDTTVRKSNFAGEGFRRVRLTIGPSQLRRNIHPDDAGLTFMLG